MARLGDVCEILNGFSFKSDQYTESGIRIIRIANVQNGYIEDLAPVFYPLDDKNALKYELAENDLLISLTGNVGRVGILTKRFLPAALNQRVACIRIKNEFELEKTFLFHFLNSENFEQACIHSSKGVAQKNMSTEWLKDYIIPLSSLDEQRKIAAVLDKVSDLIAKHRQQLDKLDLLVKSQFIEMFGDPATSQKYERIPIGELTTVTSGGTPSRKTERYWKGGNIPWVKTTELQNTTISDTEEHITETGMAESSAKYVPPETILIAMYGQGKTRGMTALLEKEATTNQACACILPSKNIDQRYLWKFMMHSYENLRSLAEGAGQPNLNAKMIKDFPVIIPPRDMQTEYVKFTEQADKSKSTIQQSLEKLETLKKSLMQEYFG